MNRSSTLYSLSILEFNYCIWSNFIYKSPQFDSGSLNHRQSLNRPGSHIDDTSICEEKTLNGLYQQILVRHTQCLLSRKYHSYVL